METAPTYTKIRKWQGGISPFRFILSPFVTTGIHPAKYRISEMAGRKYTELAPVSETRAVEILCD
jgi:hypothetical protein